MLRPKSDGRTAHFYTIVTRETVDADFAAKRQRFLAEQGYAYSIVDADDLLRLSDFGAERTGGERTRYRVSSAMQGLISNR